MLGSFIHREQYSLDLIPFDGDLLSMESESAFKVSACLISEEKHHGFLRWLSAFGTEAPGGFVSDPHREEGEQGRACGASVTWS